MRGLVIASVVLWVVVIGIVVFNAVDIGDKGYSLANGIYMNMVTCALGLIGALLMWPTSRDRRLNVDDANNIYPVER